MKNFEKYTDYKSRTMAFSEWCKTKNPNGCNCSECPLYSVHNTLYMCSMAWLELDYEKHIPTSNELIRRFAISVCTSSKIMEKILEQRDFIKTIWQKQDEERATNKEENK